MHKPIDDALLKDAKKKVSSCDRCGACLPVCPLFGAKDVEISGARGKNMIAMALAEGGIEPTPETLSAVNFCLLCRACVDNCPNAIRTDEAMIDVRQYLINRTGTNLSKHMVIANVLKRRGLVKVSAAALALLRRLGLHNMLSLETLPDEYTRRHFLAAFAGPAALGPQAPPSDLSVTSTAKVAYFQGCGMRMMFPEASAETRKILHATARVMLKDNGCCGLLHLAHGMRDDFLALAKENIRLYADDDLVVSDCASCSSMLKHVAFYFDDDPIWKDRAADFSRKVMDLTEYLVHRGYTPRKKVDAAFTYHDPCHLVRGQGIRSQPRDLLNATGRFIEMKDADTCCGGAGTFHMDYPDIASKILAKKTGNIKQTGASVVVTGCPGCLIQLTRAAKNSGNAFKAMHISQVI